MPQETSRSDSAFICRDCSMLIKRWYSNKLGNLQSRNESSQLEKERLKQIPIYPLNQSQESLEKQWRWKSENSLILIEILDAKFHNTETSPAWQYWRLSAKYTSLILYISSSKLWIFLLRTNDNLYRWRGVGLLASNRNNHQLELMPAFWFLKDQYLSWRHGWFHYMLCPGEFPALENFKSLTLQTFTKSVF